MTGYESVEDSPACDTPAESRVKKGSSTKKSKKKKRHKQEEKHEELVCLPTEKAKKKKKKKVQEEEMAENSSDEAEKRREKKKKRKHDTRDENDEEEQPKKLKKKDKKKDKDRHMSPAADEQDMTVSLKKKKKKKHREPDEEQLSANEDVASATDISKEVKAKKKKKRHQKADATDDIQCESKLNHVQDDSNDADKSSTNLGQWGTADLGDSKRQSKFFQLMGGFKGATTASSDSKSNSKPFAARFNAALDNKRAAALSNQLERQFEQARFTQLNARGLGLGFAEPKKNHIDITTSRSKKFDG